MADGAGKTLRNIGGINTASRYAILPCWAGMPVAFMDAPGVEPRYAGLPPLP